MSQDIGVFWNIERCPPPAGLSGYQVMDAIRKKLEHLGPIITLNGYLGTSIKQPPLSSVERRSQMQHAGLSMIYGGHTAHDHAAVMMANITSFLQDHLSCKVIIITSASQISSWGYQLSQLRQRGYELAFVVGGNSPGALNPVGCIGHWDDIFRAALPNSPPLASSSQTVAPSVSLGQPGSHAFAFGGHGPSLPSNSQVAPPLSAFASSSTTQTTQTILTRSMSKRDQKGEKRFRRRFPKRRRKTLEKASVKHPNA
ncbi:hypothetical protein CC1G_08701 [Coprinopsis cinerea okayama7|uniref:Uncharacterized protein n=1 Tax=Coprinopsis cinerea (strain Okayama-7 / 130 / ATCC MYA-4618 / FGSC 9003) TaxID=240176 RepID=A8NZI4_COPC7|nr:hypothetical protein CC1G_08701 [Coprinopsis cinerea okayama7\|eukprot:XP_001837688.2 hypothetical protein CC1G_08701 [Coprinopsis cinerea okayama7\